MRWSKHAMPPGLMALCLLLVACAPSTGTRPPSRDTDAAMTTPTDPSPSSSDATAAGAGTERSDRVVEVRLGPHAIRLPANYLDGQRGMDFQGNFSLVLQWPELGPYPAGVEFRDDPDNFLNAITALPYYVDRVPIEDRLEKEVAPNSEAEKGNPTRSLELRIAGGTVHGLQAYYTDFDKLRAFWTGPDSRVVERAVEPHSLLNDDWYLRRDASGVLVTFIHCTSRGEPDGVRIEERRLVDDLQVTRRALCDHSFIIPELKARVSMNYPRALLPEWRRIEERVRGLLRDGSP